MATFDASAEATATRAAIDEVQTQAEAAIARLTTQATSWTISALSAVSNLSLGTLAAADGTKPALLTPTLPTYTPAVLTTFGDKPALQDLGLADYTPAVLTTFGDKPALLSLDLPTYVPADFTGIVAPALPSAPTLAGATSSMWSEAFWTGLKSKLSLFTDSITGSDDIDSAINRLSSETDRMQSALFAKEYERKTQVLRDLYSAAEAGTGADGFTYPNSMTTALKLDAQQKFQFDLSDVSRTLIDKIFDWAKSNYQFSIQQSIAAHASDVEFNIRYLSTTVEVYSSTVNALLDKYRTDVTAAVNEAELQLKEYVGQVEQELATQRALYEIRLKEAGFDMDAAKAEAQIRLDEFVAQVEQDLNAKRTQKEIQLKDAGFDMEAAKAEAELKIKEFTVQLEKELEKQRALYDIRLKEASFDLEVDKANAIISAEDTKLKIEDFKARVASFLDTAKVNLEDRDANIKNQIQASTAAAQAATALAASVSAITLNTSGA